MTKIAHDSETAGFFSTLAKSAGSRQRENQLTSTFAACFRTAPAFRRAVLEVVRRACRLKKAIQGTDAWVCDAQVPPPKGGGGRIDLRLRSAHQEPDAYRVPVIYLESKVESPLTIDQLRRYRRKGVEYLVALTKYPAEVSERQLKRIGAFALRWQDIHDALGRALPRSPKERFVIQSFIEYLEDLGMARPDDITLNQIRSLRQLLGVVRADGIRWTIPRDSFQTADSLLTLMGEVRRRFLESYPQLDGYRKRGPGFETVTNRDCAAFDWYWTLRPPKRRGPKLVVYLWFPMKLSEQPMWCADLTIRDKYRKAPLRAVCTKGALDVNKMVASLKKWAKQWGFV